MVFHCFIESMVQAEQFCKACQSLDCSMTIHNDKGSADPRSMLGVISMMYAEHGELFVEIESATDEQLKAAGEMLRPFLPQFVQEEVS